MNANSLWRGARWVVACFAAVGVHWVQAQILPPGPQIPAVTIATVDRTATEQDPNLDQMPDEARMVVRRAGSLEFPLEVHYRVGGTATPELDYVRLPGVVTLPAGQAEVPIVVSAVDDTLVEPEETVVVSLILPPGIPGTPVPYVIGPGGHAAAVILDNEPRPNQPPRVAIVSPPDGAVLASPDVVRIVASAVDMDGRVVSVEFFADGTSLGIVERDVTLEPMPLDDTHPELGPIAPFTFLWAKPSEGAHVLKAVATDDQGSATPSEPVEIQVIAVPVQPVVTVVAMDPEASEGVPAADGTLLPDMAVFAIRRTGPTELPLEVAYRLGGTAENGVDYETLPLVATIPEGAASVEVQVRPIDDNLAEGPEKVVLGLLAPACIALFPPPADCYVVGPMREACAVIFDNETPANLPPRVEMVHPHAGEVFLAGTDIQLIAQAWDRDGEVRSVEFFEGDRSLGMAERYAGREGAFGWLWSDVPAGEYLLSAVATDDEGATQRSRPVEVKVVRREAPPVVTVTATDPEGAEIPSSSERPENPVVFRVHRTGPVERELTVFYRLGGLAENGVDYAKLPLQLVIPVGAEAAEVVVSPLDDTLAEGPEPVVFQLVPAGCQVLPTPLPVAHYVVGAPGAARGVILDDELAANLPPRVAITQPLNGAVFRAPATLTVVVAARDPDGYVPKMELFAGDRKIGEQVMQFLVPPPPGEDQVFTFEWKEVPAGGYKLRARATDDRGAEAWSSPVGILIVPELIQPVVSVVAADPLAVEPDAGTPPDTATFLIHRTGDLTLPLEVSYVLGGRAENGADYEKLSGKVVFPEGRTAMRVVVNPLPDTLLEDAENVVLELEEPACVTVFPPPPNCYQLGEWRRAEVRILDRLTPVNHPPRIELVRPCPGDMFQLPAEIKMVAMVGDPDGQVVKVEFFVDGAKVGEMPGSAPTPMDVVARAITFVWTGASAGEHVLMAVATDDDGTRAKSREVPIRVLGALEPPRVWVIATDPHAAERGEHAVPNTASFRVHRTGAVDRELVVFYSLGGTAENGKDYRELPPSVTIPAGRRCVTVIVEPINDNDPEGIETVVMALQPSPTASPIDPYRLGWPSKACAVIVDNDGPLPPLRPLPEDVVHLCLPGENGVPYRVEASEDLVHWIPVADVIAEGGQVQFAQPAMQDLRHRFYRVRPIVIEALGLGE